MRYAILSDIHSNLEALSAVLQHLATQRIDRYLCLGDLVGYGADPGECLTRLQACDALSVCGNHDWACLGKLDVRWFNEAARRAVMWTKDQLSFLDLDFLRRLPLVTTEGSLTLVHGTLIHPERFDYLVDLAQAVDTAKACQTGICLIGHTHIPSLYEYDLQQRRVNRVLTTSEELAEVRLVHDPARIRYVMNPGSVGQPRDGDPRSSVAVLDTEAWRLAIVRIPYDIAVAQRKIRQAQLPEFLADRLAVGR